MNIVEIYFKLSLTKFDSVQPWTWNGRENIFYGFLRSNVEAEGLALFAPPWKNLINDADERCQAPVWLA